MTKTFIYFESSKKISCSKHLKKRYMGNIFSSGDNDNQYWHDSYGLFSMIPVLNLNNLFGDEEDKEKKEEELVKRKRNPKGANKKRPRQDQHPPRVTRSQTKKKSKRDNNDIDAMVRLIQSRARLFLLKTVPMEHGKEDEYKPERQETVPIESVNKEDYTTTRQETVPMESAEEELISINSLFLFPAEEEEEADPNPKPIERKVTFYGHSNFTLPVDEPLKIHHIYRMNGSNIELLQ